MVGTGVPDGGQPGARLGVGAVRGQMGAARARWGVGTGWNTKQWMEFQTWDGVPVRSGVPDK